MRLIDADKLIELLRDECAEVDDGNRDIDESTCLMTFRAMHEFVNKIPTELVCRLDEGEQIPTWRGNFDGAKPYQGEKMERYIMGKERRLRDT